MSSEAIWKPPAPRGPLEKSILDAIRLNLPALLTMRPARGGEVVGSSFSAALDVSVPTRLELTCESVEGARLERRATTVFTLRGAAASSTESWIIVARVELDRDTQAALRIVAQVVSAGPVSL
jgi:hypothetical protein